MRSGLVHNGGAVPPRVAASVVLCLGRGCVEMRMGEERKKKLSNDVAQGIRQMLLEEDKK